MKIKEWLQLATGENDEFRSIDFSTEFIGEGYKFTTDGHRIHIVSNNIEPLEINKQILKTDKWEDEISESIIINPKFLIEALQIFKYDIQVVISISRNKDGEKPKVLIQGTQKNSELSAWIMGMYPSEENENNE